MAAPLVKSGYISTGPGLQLNTWSGKCPMHRRWSPFSLALLTNTDSSALPRGPSRWPLYLTLWTARTTTGRRGES